MNTGPTNVRLEAADVRFFSQGDESAFFVWLNGLPFVEGYEGRGRILSVLVNSAAVDEDGLREMLALFRRYGIALRQLAIFDRDEFADWFRDERTYWYNDIFG
jgi:hypothetical protein